MDPVSLITAALAAGLTNLSNTAVADAYAALKRLLFQRSGGQPEDNGVLDTATAEDPQTRATLEERLRAIRADTDPEVVRAAAQLLALTDPEGSQAGKYQVTVTSSQGVVIGDHNQTTQHFTGT
ncbi:hypothetical protein [Streptomyces sp. NPDC001604]|uniref:hypothetical protein n=1 Tax=Streptomyces sp. NPDC001604 TaxID=3364593 RepID=UPI0036C40F1D